MTIYERSVHHARRNTEDANGRIRIKIIKLDPRGQNHTKGNITRTITLKDGKVSDVATTIERALFGQEEA